MSANDTIVHSNPEHNEVIVTESITVIETVPQISNDDTNNVNEDALNPSSSPKIALNHSEHKEPVVSQTITKTTIIEEGHHHVSPKKSPTKAHPLPSSIKKENSVSHVNIHNNNTIPEANNGVIETKTTVEHHTITDNVEETVKEVIVEKITEEDKEEESHVKINNKSKNNSVKKNSKSHVDLPLNE